VIPRECPRTAARRLAAWIAFCMLAVPAVAQSTNCTSPPPPDPKKNFFQNFLGPCYAIPIPTGPLNTTVGGDLNTTYNRIFYRTSPLYEFLIFGEFPNARSLSITPYDDHLTLVDWLDDYQIVPMTANYQNPFLPGNTFQEDQLYAIKLTMGGTEPTPQNTTPGCGFNGINVTSNVFDITKRHPGLSWNGLPGLPPTMPVHDDIGPSFGGEITVRRQFAQPDGGKVQLQAPYIVVRDLSTGCAVPSSQVLLTDANDPQYGNYTFVLTSENTLNKEHSWQNLTQITGHNWMANTYYTSLCYAKQPFNQAVWLRSDAWVAAADPDSSYLKVNLPSTLVSSAMANQQFLRFRFKLPVMSTLPCSGCTLTGSEQLRNWSLSLAYYTTNVTQTIATISDKNLIADPNGNVSLILGFGSQPPAWVTPANYYTFIDLSSIPAATLAAVNTLILRTATPGAGFQCSASNVPFHVMEYNPVGGYMDNYAPFMDVVTASQIPQIPTVLPVKNSCGITESQISVQPSYLACVLQGVQ